MKTLIHMRDIYRVSSGMLATSTLDLVNEYYRRLQEVNNPLRTVYHNMILAILSTCEINGSFRIEETARKRIYDELERLHIDN